jgi:hypothetical protein
MYELPGLRLRCASWCMQSQDMLVTGIVPMVDDACIFLEDAITAA